MLYCAATREPSVDQHKDKIYIGVDTGGTFTDVVAAADDQLFHFKIPSNPTNPATPVLDGVRKACENQSVDIVVHGSTVATNALLERKGGKAALLVTEGFEDLLQIGRQTRPKLYDLSNPAIATVIPPDRCFGIKERTSADGTVLSYPDPSRLRNLVVELRALNIDAIAVCFLHSYANPTNERAISAALRAAGFDVTCSHDILPEYREFERCSTVAVNAFLRPVLSRYYGQLESGLPANKLRIMQSSGGWISSAAARERPVQTVLSGPAGGVVGAHTLSQLAGYANVITLDMGGTSADVSVIRNAVPLTTETIIDGLPIRLPMIDVVTVGSGGGSIAWFDAGGALRVGPRSAGADPGPVCYGKGDQLTVTDAHLLLGHIPKDKSLGGVLQLDPERTREKFELEAQNVGMPPEQLAEGIVKVASATMERALRVVSVQRGHDPRDFALFAFGGAGGLHACRLAETMCMQTVIVPDKAGTISALGMLIADAVRDYSRTIFLRGEQLNYDVIADSFKPLEKMARADFKSDGFAKSRLKLLRAVTMRYEGQSFELEIPLTRNLRSDFDTAHKKRYSYADLERPVEVVNIVLRVVGTTEKPFIPESAEENYQPDAGLTEVIFEGRKHDARSLFRAELKPGAEFSGPAVVYDIDSTALVPPGWQACIDRWRNLIIRREEKK